MKGKFSFSKNPTQVDMNPDVPIRLLVYDWDQTLGSGATAGMTKEESEDHPVTSFIDRPEAMLQNFEKIRAAGIHQAVATYGNGAKIFSILTRLYAQYGAGLTNPFHEATVLDPNSIAHEFRIKWPRGRLPPAGTLSMQAEGSDAYRTQIDKVLMCNHLCGAFRVQPGAAMLVDDSRSNIDRARAEGFRVFFIDYRKKGKKAIYEFFEEWDTKWPGGISSSRSFPTRAFIEKKKKESSESSEESDDEY